MFCGKIGPAVWPLWANEQTKKHRPLTFQPLVEVTPLKRLISWGIEWRPRRNHPCQILCQSVQEFLGGSTPSSAIFSEREFTFARCRPSVCLSVVCCLSVVWNIRAPYSGDWNFQQCFYAIWYVGHLWPFGKNFSEIVPGEPLRRRVKTKRVEKCSDFGPFQGYISETVKDKR